MLVRRNRREIRRVTDLAAGRRWHNPAIAAMATLADGLCAVMMARPDGESLRAEALRRGITVYEVRAQRGEKAGYTRRESVRSLRRVVQIQGYVVGADGELHHVVARGLEETSRLGELLRDQRVALANRPGEFRQKWAGRRIAGVRLSGDVDRLMVAYRRDPRIGEVRYRRWAGHEGDLPALRRRD
jgi:hypothetical protein